MDISQIFVVGLHIIILSFQQTYGSISSFLPSGTVKVGEQFQISCKINSFPTGDDATLNRNGSLLNTCFQDGGCTRGATQTIDGALFSFTGDSEGIHLTINHLPQSEVGLLYVCVKDGSVEYTVVISTTIPPTTTPTTTTIPSTAPTTTAPSTSSNTCIFFKEESCVFNYCILAFIVLLVLIAIGSLIKWIINRTRQENSSATAKKKTGNKTV